MEKGPQNSEEQALNTIREALATPEFVVETLKNMGARGRFSIRQPNGTIEEIVVRGEQ